MNPHTGPTFAAPFDSLVRVSTDQGVTAPLTAEELTTSGSVTLDSQAATQQPAQPQPQTAQPAPDFAQLEAAALAELKETHSLGAAVADVSGDRVVFA